MNINSSTVNPSTKTQPTATSTKSDNSSTGFADELNELKKADTEKAEKEKETKPEKTKADSVKNNASEKEEVQNAEENLNKSLKELNSLVKNFNQSEENFDKILKTKDNSADTLKKGEILINNDFNIQDNKDTLPQMSPNMNFSGNGQPFSSFMGNSDNSDSKLRSSNDELAEESKILSTMAENIAIANKNTLLQDNEGIKKIDTKSGITPENIVKYDSVIMNQADVELFANLIANGEVDLSNVAPEAAAKSVHISKTLADMIAKAKDSQQPLRIDFDNGISVIIKISRERKLSADFLPSTQIAEAYLKENLPILKQRFDEKNIDYEELNHRQKREQDKNNSGKKGRKDE